MPHREAIHAKIIKFFDTGKLTDVNFACQTSDRIFECHQLILAASSAYFDAMFNDNIEESGNDAGVEEITVLDLDGAVFEKVLHFLYTGDIAALTKDLNSENVHTLLHISESFSLYAVRDQCIRYLTKHKTQKDCPQVLDGCSSVSNAKNLTSRFSFVIIILK